MAQGLRLIAIDIERFLKYDRKICFYLKFFLSEKRWRLQSCCRMRMKWYYLPNLAFFLALKGFFSKIRNFSHWKKIENWRRTGSSRNMLQSFFWKPFSQKVELLGSCLLSFRQPEWRTENHPRKRWLFLPIVCQFCSRLAEARLCSEISFQNLHFFLWTSGRQFCQY